jgi:hypothetical protein
VKAELCKHGRGPGGHCGVLECANERHASWCPGGRLIDSEDLERFIDAILLNYGCIDTKNVSAATAEILRAVT